MEIDKICSIMETFFNRFNIMKFDDEKLKYSSNYYADAEHKKFLLYCQIFDTKKALLDNWEVIENEDIAFYLQGKKFAKHDLRWDMYYLLLYNGTENIDEDIYVKIERNRFCSRKIILLTLEEEQFSLELSKKLPFTNAEFYPDNDLCLVSNHDFFEEFRNIANLDKKIYTDDLIENIENNYEKWIDLLFNKS